MCIDKVSGSGWDLQENWREPVLRRARKREGNTGCVCVCVGVWDKETVGTVPFADLVGISV